MNDLVFGMNPSIGSTSDPHPKIILSWAKDGYQGSHHFAVNGS
jgi:hypothetical protein